MKKIGETLYCRSRGISTEEEDIRGFRQWNPSMQEDLLILRFVPVTFRSFLKVHKIENFFDSDFGICVISLIVMSKY